MHKLPELPYSNDALEPTLDARTMQIHHDKHHGGYVNKLNTALEKVPERFRNMDIMTLMTSLNEIDTTQRTAVAHNGCQHYNHTLFWNTMIPGGAKKPTGDLATAINNEFGSFDKFKTEFENAATTQFGSGWAWLVRTPNGLKVYNTSNHLNPVVDGTGTPLMVIDVWEHAYYLKYQNRRQEFVQNFWNVVNWDEVNKRYTQTNK